MRLPEGALQPLITLVCDHEVLPADLGAADCCTTVDACKEYNITAHSRTISLRRHFVFPEVHWCGCTQSRLDDMTKAAHSLCCCFCTDYKQIIEHTQKIKQ